MASVNLPSNSGSCADFMTNDQEIVFTNMQPTHLGQTFVRFKNAFDRDWLIERGPIHFGDVVITFVEHNKGCNWRAVNFNRECWLMLMGYPPDFREDEFIVNTINSFGRVLHWVDDGIHLSSVLVRAWVIDLELVPQFLFVTEGKGFQGESWTVQCEILQGNLLGGLASDEDPAPGPDDFPPGGPFNLFGFGQNGPGPAFQPQQQNGPNMFAGGPNLVDGGNDGQNNGSQNNQVLNGGPNMFVGSNAEQNNQAMDGAWDG